MPAFNGHKMTAAGIVLEEKLKATGQEMVFSSVQLGDGTLGGQGIKDLTALISPRLTLPIAKTPINKNGGWDICALLDSTKVTTPFYFREWGITAQDPDTGADVLMFYSNSGTKADYLEPWADGSSQTYIETELVCTCHVSDEINVTAVVEQWENISINLTLLADNWTGAEAPYIQTLAALEVKENMEGVAGLAQNATLEERSAAREAMLSLAQQKDCEVTFIADGEKPEINIPVTLILMGG